MGLFQQLRQWQQAVQKSAENAPLAAQKLTANKLALSKLLLAQLLLGLLGIGAMLSSPAEPACCRDAQASVAEPVANSAVAEPVFRLADLSPLSVVGEWSPFLLPEFSFTQVIKQAVVFCEFFVKSYRLAISFRPPIRAGPKFAPDF